ncbi:MAG: glycoside hydrolase family protein [Alphaproteobacteria bacterium]
MDFNNFKYQFKTKSHFLAISGLVLMLGSQTALSSEIKIEAGTVDAYRDEPVLRGPSVLNDDERFVWGGSVIKGDDGKYHMFYSTWESGEDIPKFSDSWVLYSKIAYAVSDYPDRDFKTQKIFLPGSADAGNPDAWDAQFTHNPHIQKFDGKYYLYYVGSKDPGVQPPGSSAVNVNKRNRVQQLQKIGVIAFDSFDQLLDGTFERPTEPILVPRTRVKADDIVAPSPCGTEPLPDNIIVTNPSVVRRPSDGKYLLYFKGNIYDPEWKGVHGVAIGDTPTGPFTPLDQFVFKILNEDGTFASAEDPYVWYHPKHEKFYAVIKDFTGKFTEGKPGLAILESKDGLEWTKPAEPFFMKKEITLKTGEVIPMDRLERPQILIDEDGNPQVLYAAGAINNVNIRQDGSSFNIQIPLKTIAD